MPINTILLVIAAVVIVLLLAYIVSRVYIARTDRTFMVHDDRGYRRALQGRGVLWYFMDSIVKGPAAPKVEFVAFDPTTGKRRAGQLLDPRTGAVNLRPQYCVPLPFFATTTDSHRMIVEARVQFSLNRELLKHVYQMEDFGLALETRIQSAVRAEIGQRHDEVLRASLHEVEAGVIQRLRTAEREGDELGEEGMALGVVFHTASITAAPADDHMDSMSVGMPAPVGVVGAEGETAAPGQAGVARAAVRSHGVLALKPQQVDLLADVFKGRDPASTQAILTMMDMQTRQNIAEALAASGQLMVVTSNEVGLTGEATKQDALDMTRARAAAAQSPVNPGPGPAR
jgi:hypothetical protein